MVPVVKNPPANTGDLRDPGCIPGSGRSPGGGHGNPLQCHCLGDPMDRGAWRAVVHMVRKSQIQLKWLKMHKPMGTGFWISHLKFKCNTVNHGEMSHSISNKEETNGKRHFLLVSSLRPYRVNNRLWAVICISPTKKISWMTLFQLSTATSLPSLTTVTQNASNRWGSLHVCLCRWFMALGNLTFSTYNANSNEGLFSEWLLYTNKFSYTITFSLEIQELPHQNLEDIISILQIRLREINDVPHQNT